MLKKSADYRTVERVLRAFDERAWASSGADELAAGVGVSRDLLDTLFMRWAGVPLTRFLHSLSLSQTRRRLVETGGLPAPSLLPQPSGSESSVLHEGGWCVRSLLSGQEKGQGLTISYGLYPTPFGDCLLAMSGRQICHLSFVDDGRWQGHLQELRRKWPQAGIIGEEGEDGRQVVERIFASVTMEPLPLLLKGTDFQLRVWQGLLALPRGAMTSYQDLAVYLGYPAACRAVAGAVAANPVSWLIPCHRVIRKSGEIHRYRWGSSRKKAMLGWEACRL